LAGFCNQSSAGAVQQDAGDHDGLQQGRADMITMGFGFRILTAGWVGVRHSEGLTF
jgi:hypothetical protein